MKKLPRNLCPCGNKTKRHTTTYCSIECRALYKQKGNRFGGPKIRYGPKPCQYCKKIFKPYRKSQNFCTRECVSLNKKGIETGPNLKLRGIKRSAETLKKLSEIAKIRFKGKNNPRYGTKASHGRGEWHTSWNGKKFWLRSSWEKKFAEYLDQKKTSYEVEFKAFEITYIYDGKIKEGTYRPDFYLINEDRYIEVKGYWRDDAEEKYKAFLEQYPEIKIELFNKEKLKETGIL